MSGLIKSSLKNPKFKDKDLAKPFGYGAPFSSRYRSWLHKTGVAHMGLPLELTDMGEVVVDKDPTFKSLTTQWFLHHELTGDAERAEPWHYFANEFLPKNKEFTRDQLLDGLTNLLKYHSEQHFGPGSQLNKVILRKIVECYTEDHALGGLGLLRVEGDKLIRGTASKKQGPWKTAQALSKAYS
jgi:hypothetical protein